jgi:environmental stress-induced protein Ves
MALHLVDVHDCPAQPWRNGGGLTRELLAWPAAADWLVRVSVARIAQDGVFSPFPGMRRWFSVVHGAGVQLTLPQGEVTLTPADAPLAFDGEVAPMCRLLEGPTEDLNLMAPRHAGRLQMQRATHGGGIDGPTRWRGLFAAERVLFDVGDHTQVLHAGMLAWSDDHDAEPWQLHEGQRAWFLSLED